MFGPLLALWFSCSGQRGPAAPQVGPLDLGHGRARDVIHLLDRVSAAGLQLSADNLPAQADEPRHYTLDSGWRPAPWGDGRVWRHVSPIRFSQKRFSLAPVGLVLESAAQPLAWDTRIVDDASLAQRWILWNDEIFLISRLDPGRWPQPPVLTYVGAGSREAGLNLDRSGLDPLDFARRELSIGLDSHPCLYLPAPSSAEIEVDLPAGSPSLRLGLGLAPTEEEQVHAQGALDVSVNGAPLTRLGVQTGEGWRSTQADLAPWAGQHIMLRLATDPMGDPARDYLCVATPEVVAGPPPAGDPLRVIVIGIDTLRADHLGANGYTRATSPNLDALAQQSVVFTHAWAPAPRTRPSFRTATTGRFPLRAMGATTTGSVLRGLGLQTGGIVANVHLAPRLGFAEGFEDWSYDNGANAGAQVDRALAWLDAHEAEDSFLFLHLMDPHTFYLPPAPFRDRFTGGLDRGFLPDRFNRWMVLDWDAKGSLAPTQKQWIGARYDGEIAYTDEELGRLIQAVDALPGRTLLVLHSDHGEELWDHGGYEHNHSLYDELTRVVLWIRPPGGVQGGPLRIDAPVSLADLAPTLFDALGVPADQRPDTDGTSLWPLVDPARAAEAPALTTRLDQRPLHQGYLMFDTERFSVVARGPAGHLHKYILQTDSGTEQLFDLQADPGEQQDLAQQAGFDPAPWARALAASTGWPVGPGWRLHLSHTGQPFTLRFAEPVEAAGVVDPEAALTRRANLEWGEEVAHRPEDVATVTLSEDHRTVQVTPGPWGVGTVWVLGPSAQAAATVDDAGGTRPALQGPQVLGGVLSRIQAGTVLVPLETEAAAIAAANGGEDATDEQIQALRELGYVE